LQALEHWQRFVQLAPRGPWADEARSQISFLQDSGIVDAVSPTAD